VTTLPLPEVEPGVFETSTTADLSGLYRFRLRAEGVTLRGVPFTRERLLSGAVWRGGNGPLPGTTIDPRQPDERLCRLLDCLLGEDSVQRYLKQQELDPQALRRCLGAYCARPREGGQELHGQGENQEKEVRRRKRQR
jgi:hypothetical protein